MTLGHYVVGTVWRWAWACGWVGGRRGGGAGLQGEGAEAGQEVAGGSRWMAGGSGVRSTGGHGPTAHRKHALPCSPTPTPTPGPPCVRTTSLRAHPPLLSLPSLHPPPPPPPLSPCPPTACGPNPATGTSHHALSHHQPSPDDAAPRQLEHVALAAHAPQVGRQPAPRRGKQPGVAQVR